MKKMRTIKIKDNCSNITIMKLCLNRIISFDVFWHRYSHILIKYEFNRFVNPEEEEFDFELFEEEFPLKELKFENPFDLCNPDIFLLLLK